MSSRIAGYCLLGGLPLLLPALSMGHLAWWYISGVVLAAAFVPVALFGPRTVLGQFSVIFPVLFIMTVLTTWSEGLLFIKAPEIQEHAARNLLGSTAVYLIVAGLLAALARVLRLRHESSDEGRHRAFWSAAGMILICAFAYMLYYLVFGAITYQYFTKVYYSNAAELIAPLGLWFWAIQIARGLLMTVAVVPTIYALRLPRGKVALCTGLLIWVAGGLAPLLVPNAFMSGTQRLIHVIEIFTQNFTLGITAGLLLRPNASAEPASASATGAA
jgi:hypothetical protein